MCFMGPRHGALHPRRGVPAVAAAIPGGRQDGLARLHRRILQTLHVVA